MLKKIVLLGTLVFLLFEVLFFDSNNKISNLEESDGLDVYKISINESKEEFMEDYENIILEVNEDEVTVLTNSSNFSKIKEKYPITIVK